MECVAHATLTTLRHVYGYTPVVIIAKAVGKIFVVLQRFLFVGFRHISWGVFVNITITSNKTNNIKLVNKSTILLRFNVPNK